MISMSHYLFLSTALMTIGVIGVLTRRNMVIMKGHDNGAKTGISHHLGLRIIHLQRGVLHVDLGLGLSEARARL